tara:strand:- start:1424 stop:1957 length:534 start_codon:yes stop_codon:yes gene_type:complete
MLGCSKKFLIVIVLLSIFNINKVYSDENCKLPYKLPSGDIITQNVINELKMQVQMSIRDLGISKQEIKELIINEFKQGSLFSSGSGSVYDNFVQECKKYGPIEYNRLNKCGVKWINQILNINLSKENLNLPVCTVSISESSDKNNNLNSNSFMELCKNSKLSDLDKDVAILCLEKMK